MHFTLIGAELEENLALRYLQGAVEAHGHTVTLVPFDGPSDTERAAATIVASRASVAGFSMVFTRRGREFAELIARCRELGFAGLTLAGGHFAAFHAEQLLRDLPTLDAIAVGEGESILCELASHIDHLDRVQGLVWRDGDRIVRNPPALAEQDLDKLPWPSHRRPFDRYLGLPIVNMLASRGCIYSCAFCSIAAWHKMCGGARYRYRSASGLAAEMGCLWREGVRVFNFHDDNFLGTDREENLSRARALRDALRDQGIGKLAFAIKARPDAIDPELFALLRSMGLFRVFLGIEAGTDTSLLALGRGQKLADNVRALDLLHGLDLHVAFNLLVLNPESTLEDLADNVAFLRSHADSPMNFCRTEVYAGTPLEKRLAKQDRLRGDYWGQDYVIPDSRAQEAFEIAMGAFWNRNFGAHPLHYLSGQVDYEHQLRADFFGTTPEIRASAKGFVRAVNLNTVGYLEETIAQVRQGRAQASFASSLAARVAADDVRMAAEGQAVLAQIRELPAPRKRSATSRVAVAASIAITLAGCPSPREQTQYMEAAPQPTGTPAPTPADAAPQPDAFIPPQVMEAAPYPPNPPPPPPNDKLIATEPDASAPAAKDAGTKPSVKDAGPAPVHTLDLTHMREAAPAPTWKPQPKK